MGSCYNGLAVAYIHRLMQKTERLYTAWECSRSDEAEETGMPRSRSDDDDVSGLLYGRAQKEKLYSKQKENKMIQHWLVGKNVKWYTLEETSGKRRDYRRQYHAGRVLHVDESNTLASVQKTNGDVCIVDVCELEKETNKQ